MSEVQGRIAQILGNVVDVKFPAGELPDINEALRVAREEGEPDLVLEVQLHMGDNLVKTVAMDSTDGLQRGLPVIATGSAITVRSARPRWGVCSTYWAAPSTTSRRCRTKRRADPFTRRRPILRTSRPRSSSLKAA